MNSGWETKTLADVCVVEKRQALHKALPYVGLENIESQTGRFIGLTEALEVKSSTFLFTQEHVLFGRLRPYLNKVMLPDFVGHWSTEIFPLKPRPGLSREYLRYWLMADSTVDQIDATSTGTRMPRANISAVLDLVFPLASLSDQQRIVCILDEAFQGVAIAKANTEKNLKNARAIFESKLNTIFTRKGDGWELKTLNDISDVKGGKRVPKGCKLQVEQTNHPYITVSDFGDNGTIDTSRIRYITDEIYAQIRRYTISDKDLYLSIAGTIGKTGYVPAELNGANLTENACKLVLRPGIDRDFLYYFTKTWSFAEQAGANTRTSAQPKLALERLKTIEISMPPLLEQRHIVESLDDLQEQSQRLEFIYQRKLEQLDTLKKSLLHHAFTGQL